MTVSNENPLPDLVEFLIEVTRPNQTDQKLTIFADLRIAPAEIHEDPICFLVKVKRLILNFDGDGLRIASGSRFGEMTKQNTIETKTVLFANSKSSKEGDVKLNVDREKIGHGDLLAIRAVGSRNYDIETREEVTERQPRLRMRTLPNSRWELREPQDAPLDGTYLEHELLCSVEPSTGSNRRALQIRIICHQSDLELVPMGGLLDRVSITKQRMAAIVVAKSISNTEKSNSGNYRGKIVIAQSEYCDEE